MKTKQKAYFAFVLLGAYILFQFFWWAYHLIDIHGDVLQLETAMALDDTQRKMLSATFSRKKWMIFGEGCVFLVILGFGLYKIQKYWKNEVRANEQRANFLLSVTHEFKSPLAAIKLHLQTLRRQQLSPEQKTHILSRGLEETERLNTLAENILLATKIEQNEHFLHFEKLDLSTLCAKTIDQLSTTAGKNHTTEIHIAPDLYISGDMGAVESVLRNIYENSAKYSPEKSTISVSLRSQNGECMLQIANDGPSIPEKERERIFERFYRIGDENTRSAKGTGLGLYLVREILTAHRGSVKILDKAPAETVFEVILPLI